MNTDLANKVADVIEFHPERWEQGDWVYVPIDDDDEDEDNPYTGPDDISVGEIAASLTDKTRSPFVCQTTGCVAGWACFIGLPPEATVGVYGSMYVRTPDGHEEFISAKAQELLDLHDDQADWLFSGGRRLSEVLWALRNSNPKWNPDTYYAEI